MDSARSIALDLIKDVHLYLEQHPDPIFADAEDCDYYRKKFNKKCKKTIPLPPPPTVIQLPPPPPAPMIIPTPVPKPVVVAAPPPPKIFEEPIRVPSKPLVFSSEWAYIFKKIAPELAILKNPPSDAVAKKINTRWKTKNQTAPITILYYQEIPEQKILLEEITKALDVYFGPAKLVFAEPIEREKQWEVLLTMPELELIICCDYTLWQLGSLMKFYAEVPTSKIEQPGIVSSRQLGDKPLFLLPDLSLYLKDPLLKRSLWKALCQTLSTQQSSSTKI